MSSEKQLLPGASTVYLDEYRLYQTSSNIYIAGRYKGTTLWRVLKIDISEPSELIIREDSTTYAKDEFLDLLKRIQEGNRKTGGLKFVTAFYGIIGVVRYSGPYYMLLITKRREVGVLFGHIIYAIERCQIFTIPNSSVQPNMAYCIDEKRYKKLLSKMDLTKDFFYSYSYHVMHSLQKNLCVNGTRLLHTESMFVWNEFLTREFLNNSKTSLWTVALVYGFFHQVNLSTSGNNFMLVLIARRSQHNAGTRYSKRGVNESGRVANDVETEQIVIKDAPAGHSVLISSVVQNRGSIPLFWSQQTSCFNIRPDIILSKEDPYYVATRQHFQDLVERHGNPITIWNLIKIEEKHPRESKLGAEFAKVIRVINKDLPKKKHLRFLHWDLSKNSKNKAVDVLEQLGKFADKVLESSGIFCCQMTSNSELEGLLSSSLSKQNNDGHCLSLERSCREKYDCNNDSVSTSCHFQASTFQKGVLRTNCIDCLDRTNVAQYTYGLAALGCQLHALGILQSSSIDINDPLADDLMKIYECMGDVLALQYGGSAAHNKIFCQRRGQIYAAIKYQELFRILQRYINNTYLDGEKQEVIDVFLGNLPPLEEQPASWELSSDQHLNISETNNEEENRSVHSRSSSNGSMMYKSDCHMASSSWPQCVREPGSSKGLPGSTPEISISRSDISY